jgi:hypothetical protein
MSLRGGLMALSALATLLVSASERQLVLDAMEARPSGVWPRGAGHVVLAVPGSPENEKAYLEPGGSFSPSFGSFGVQIAVENSDRELEAVSDFVSMADVKQAFLWPRGRAIPAVRTDTPDYVATWSLPELRQWRLDVTTRRQPRLVLALRSVGPAGGPVTNASWDGHAVRLNGRWSVSASRIQRTTPRAKSRRQPRRRNRW